MASLSTPDTQKKTHKHRLTAIIRTQEGHENTLCAELLKVGAFARDHEPGPIGFHVGQDPHNACVFTTYERFTDKAAMEPHNNGAGLQDFLAAAGGLLDGDLAVVAAVEIWPDSS